MTEVAITIKTSSKEPTIPKLIGGSLLVSVRPLKYCGGYILDINHPSIIGYEVLVFIDDEDFFSDFKLNKEVHDFLKLIKINNGSFLFRFGEIDDSKNWVENIQEVIDIDCIGSKTLEYSKTYRIE